MIWSMCMSSNHRSSSGMSSIRSAVIRAVAMAASNLEIAGGYTPTTAIVSTRSRNGVTAGRQCHGAAVAAAGGRAGRPGGAQLVAFASASAMRFLPQSGCARRSASTCCTTAAGVRWGSFAARLANAANPRKPCAAQLPGVERPAAHMGFATGRGHLARRLPGRKQQLARLCRSQWKMNVFGSHTTIIPGFGGRSKCAGPLHYLHIRRTSAILPTVPAVRHRRLRSFMAGPRRHWRFFFCP